MTKMNTFWFSTLVVLQWSLLKDSTGLRTCQPVSPFNSPYVTPIYEQYSVGPGCYSRAKTSTSEEVHIINIKNSQETADSKPEIFLNIRPIAATGTYDKPIIFVLNSEQAVLWRIQGDRISHEVQHVFHVRRGSKVKTGGDLQVDVHKEHRLPKDSNRLLEWAKERYGVATSFTEIQRADHIYVRVGEVSLLPPDCVLASNFFSPNTMAAYQEKQPASGCALPQSRDLSDKEVHVIEVHSISKQVRENAEIQNAILKIASDKEDEGAPRKNVLLILKGPSGVNWQVSAERITGNVEILTNGNVDVVDVDQDSLTIQPVGDAGNPLKSGSELINWAAQRYKHLVSYTEAQLANMFNVQLARTFSDEESIDVEPPLLDPSSTKQIVHYAMSVDCHAQGITVAVKKDALEMFGISGDSLSLEDRSCRASENATHYTLSTLLDGCDTQLDDQATQVIFTNALVVTSEFTVEGSATETLDASAVGEVPPSDDEDLQTLKIEFSCQYHTGRVDEDVPIQKGDDPTRIDDYTMRVFETALYVNEHTSFPWTVGINHAQIHVELGLRTDLDMFGVMPQNCWLSSSADQGKGPGAVMLIENGCHDSRIVTEDLSLSDLADRFDMPSQTKLYRFSFYVTSQEPQYVHCEITTCAREKNTQLPLPLCLNQVERCIQLQAQPDIDHTSLMMLGHKTLGPIQLQGNPGSGSGSKPKEEVQLSGGGGQTDEPPTGASKQQQPINEIIIGLETGAVVGIAFAAFIIGVLLTAALWYIHTHTGPMMQKQPQQASEETPPQHPQFGQFQGVTIGNGPTANGHAVHSYPYPSSMSTPMSAMST